MTLFLDGNSTDTDKVTGVALCYQVRSLDQTARQASYAARVEPHVINEILSLIVDLIDPQ